MECPKCGLINLESATRCDWGYDFISGEEKESYLYQHQKVKILIARDGFTAVE